MSFKEETVQYSSAVSCKSGHCQLVHVYQQSVLRMTWWKRQVFSLKWKNKGVIHGESGDDKDVQQRQQS